MSRMSITAGLVALGLAVAAPTAAAANPLKVTGVTVKSVQVTGANSLLATVDLTGQLVGRAFTLRDIRVPITLTQTGVTMESDGTVCPILSLALEIERLSILGLVVELNDCNEGPVTVVIEAVEGGGLLGDLLCSLAGPTGILGDLRLVDPAGLTGLVQGVLDGVFKSLVTSGKATGEPSNSASPAACDILTLELGPITLNLLGLVVKTSPICLFVFAEPNEGLLGDLLCQLTDAIDGGANRRAIDALVTQILRVISRL